MLRAPPIRAGRADAAKIERRNSGEHHLINISTMRSRYFIGPSLFHGKCLFGRNADISGTVYEYRDRER